MKSFLYYFKIFLSSWQHIWLSGLFNLKRIAVKILLWICTFLFLKLVVHTYFFVNTLNTKHSNFKLNSRVLLSQKLIHLRLIYLIFDFLYMQLKFQFEFIFNIIWGFTCCWHFFIQQYHSPWKYRFKISNQCVNFLSIIVSVEIIIVELWKIHGLIYLKYFLYIHVTVI